MSLTWQQHIDALRRMMAENQPRPAPPTVFPQTAPVGMPAPNDPMSEEGGASFDGLGVAPTTYGDPVTGFAAPSIMALSQTAGINPTAGRLGMAALGMSHPAVGFGLGAANLGFNAANTSANLDMLNGLGVEPGTGRAIGGILGFNPLAGTYSGALNYGMGQQLPGWQGLQIEQEPGFNARGWQDISAQMGPTANAAPIGQVTSSPLGPPIGGTEQTADTGTSGGGWGAGTGYGGFDGWGGFQQGGYTGAGGDGVVQPSRPAGVVHEGEFVIPEWMLRGMLGWR